MPHNRMHQDLGDNGAAPHPRNTDDKFVAHMRDEGD